MNKVMAELWPMIEGTHAMRDELLDSLRDVDLEFSPGGTNMMLGELCREMGDVEHSYLESVKTLKQDWSYRHPDRKVERSKEALLAWWHSLDSQLEETLSAMSDAGIALQINRGFTVTIEVQLQIYLQALLIFLGKATIFLRAMNKTLTEKLADWIG